MPAKRRKQSKPKKTRGRRRPAAKTRATRDEEAFTRSLIAHGQAAKVGPDGQLPPGATHELIEDENGKLKAIRRRFSAF